VVNSIPDAVVNADFIDIFKSKLNIGTARQLKMIKQCSGHTDQNQKQI